MCLGEERIAVLESFDHRHHEATVGVPNQSPEIIEVNSQQMEELLDRAASNTLREQDTELIRQIFDSYVQLFQVVGDTKGSQ